MIDSTTVDLTSTIFDLTFLIKIAFGFCLVIGIYYVGYSRGKAPIQGRLTKLDSRLTQYRSALKQAREKSEDLEIRLRKLGAETKKGRSEISQKDKDYEQSVRSIRAENQEIVSKLIEDHNRKIKELEDKLKTDEN